MPTKKKRPTFDGHRLVASPDGALTFVLTRTRVGVQVERRQQVKESSHTGFASMEALFVTTDEFARFCAADRLRFAYPLTYQQVHREFNDLFVLDP
jgi:hypothetical protein